MKIYEVTSLTPVATYQNLAGSQVDVVDCAISPAGHEPDRELPARFTTGFDNLPARTSAYCNGCGTTAGDADELADDPHAYKHVPLATTNDGPQRVILMGSETAGNWARAHAANCAAPTPIETAA